MDFPSLGRNDLLYPKFPALQIKKLGLETSFIGRFGDDTASEFLISELNKFNINET